MTVTRVTDKLQLKIDRTDHRHQWSWRSCFAAFKHNKKSKKHNRTQSANLQQNGHTQTKQLPTVNENSSLQCISSNISLTDESIDQFTAPSSCIVKVDSNEKQSVDEDSIQQIDINLPLMNQNSLSSIRPVQLDAIVEDSNEENSDGYEEIISAKQLCCDRDIITDANMLYSRLFDLSQMNHVKTQFRENGNLLGEFSQQLEKLKVKTNDIVRTSAQMPRDAELLEARYSSLVATIESLSILLRIAQIPACRALVNRLFFSIEQRTEQLNKLVELTFMSLYNIKQRSDSCDDDLSSFRSALSSYEHLLTTFS
ncbi:unnamed protein product [Adineta ricciae]|uniref:Uncharacterized protein n=1 Tax=Adineta ricciae TaxID=249248 RepID=A0A814XR51_ADIRI|nr:unnamed protein product [Adineta ricciae]